MSTTVRPHVLTPTVRPPIGLPEPGLTTTLVTPPDSASSKPTSYGSMPSSARKRAPFGSVISLVSLPDQPSPSSCTPRWACASMKPGSTHPPAASTISASAGTSTSAPTAAIVARYSSTVPPSIGSPSTGTTYPFVIAIVIVRYANEPSTRTPHEPLHDSPGS